MTDRERKRLEDAGLIYPKPMPEPAVYYMSPESKYPDQIRLSFPDGKTIVYDRRIKQPSPKKYLNMPRHAKKG